MATTKITDLTAYTDPVNTDVLPIVDVTSDVTKKVSIANVMKNASLGTAALPGIAFDGDPNTGIYSPGADQVAVTTGGTQRLLIDSAGAVTIAGDLTVNGTTTNINTTNLVIEDKNIILGDVAVPTDVTADGGGITLKGATDKTINWVDSTDAWTSSERFSYPLGSAAAPTLTFTGDPNTGIYSPGADQVAISTNAVERVEFGTSEVVFNDGGANYDFRIEGDTDANLFFVDASTDRVGLGTSSPAVQLHVAGTTAEEYMRVGPATGDPLTTKTIISSIYGDTTINGAGPGLRFWAGVTAAEIYGTRQDNGDGGALHLDVRTSGTLGTALYIDSSKRVGIGTTGPASELDVVGLIRGSQLRPSLADSAATPGLQVYNEPDTGFFRPAANTIGITVGGSEAARIDSSGRLLVGTNTARDLGGFSPSIFEGINASGSRLVLFQNSSNTSAGCLHLGKSRGASVGSNTIVEQNDELGVIRFNGADGTDSDSTGAEIRCLVDGTPGANDMPGRLVFSTTADGASSPTERMRISSDGTTLIGKTSSTITAVGAEISSGAIWSTRSAATGIRVNRLTDDGNLVEFLQDSIQEGAISVSGTTVTYGGGHLARWSQLPNNENPSSILKGTVMSNLDEMCEWGEEDNEQLNKTKVSDVEGDPNVAGVFVSTSLSEDGPLDFFVGMTGDMIIRIAEGVTVQRGDLLMSAGDGTAKPQDDDIIRSKTVAKVTSTHITCTYDDGSYCVPCVLMAC
jgi:hypothetical protein